MVTIELSEAEATALVGSLEWLLSETRMEISNTESMNFRSGLKVEKAALQHLIEQMRTAMTAGAAEPPPAEGAVPATVRADDDSEPSALI